MPAENMSSVTLIVLLGVIAACLMSSLAEGIPSKVFYEQTGSCKVCLNIIISV